MGSDEVERTYRQRKGLRIVTVALAGLAAATLMGHPVAGNAAKKETGTERMTVERNGVPVYSHMATTGIVVMQLMRGDVVEVERADTTSEGEWCRIREAAIWGRSGYVRCQDLKQAAGPSPAAPTAPAPPEAKAPSVAQTPRPADTPATKPTTKVTVPEVTGQRGYTVQVASLVFERNALALKARLERLGFHPIIRTTTASITRHRVYGGEFQSRKEAEQTARRLNIDGFPSNLVAREDGQFFLEVGSFFTLDEAIDLARALQKKNYAPKIVSKPAPTPIHAVRVGEYQSRSDALETRSALKSHGFNPLIVSE
jgi:cell division septation protein DedD